MVANKTVETTASVDDFIARVEPAARRAEVEHLRALFVEVTGFAPRMWGPSIIGFGRYHYRYGSGREGDFLATGFSPRKSDLTIYIMPGYADYGAILKDLGKHRLGKSCLYIKRLSDIDEAILKRLIRQGLEDLHKIWPVSAS
jgi:hypothetical protein